MASFFLLFFFGITPFLSNAHPPLNSSGAGLVAPEICDNGIDDDGDGLIDCADPDCATYLAFANINWSAGALTGTAAYPSGGIVNIDAVHEYTRNGSPIAYTPANGFPSEDISADYYVSALSDPTVSSNIAPDGISGDDSALMLWYVSGATYGDIRHKIEMDFTNTSKGYADRNTVIGISTNYPDVISPTNIESEYIFTAIKTNGSLETDYSAWEFYQPANPNQPSALSNGTGGHTIPYDGITNTSGSFVIDAGDITTANYTFINDLTTGFIKLPDGVQYQTVYFERHNVHSGNSVTNAYGTNNYNDYEFSTIMIGETISNCAEICGNGIDDNGNGLIDCADPDCTTSAAASSDVPKTISSSSATTITSTLVFPSVGTIEDVNVQNLNISHTYIDDVIVTLTSPGGTSVVLLNQPCNSEDNILMDLDDEASSGSFPCPPTNGQAYQPANPLSAFDGESSSGTWTLSIQDTYGAADGGSLNGWELEISLECIATEICDNGIDDDGDGQIDCADGDCGTPNITLVTPTHPNNCPASNNGQIVISASGSNLQYSINGGTSFQGGNSFGGLTAGTYNIVVENTATGCQDSDLATLTNAACAETCDNGIDDDGDGLVDTADPDCICSSTNNLALGQTTSQSSTGYGGTSDKAVDGNTSGNWGDNSVTHTAGSGELQPWWEVDLGEVKGIQDIVIWNRTDCCSNRLSDFYVFVSDVPFTSTDLNTTLNQAGVWSELTADYPVSSLTLSPVRNGRYVRVQLSGSSVLSLG